MDSKMTFLIGIITIYLLFDERYNNIHVFMNIDEKIILNGIPLD